LPRPAADVTTAVVPAPHDSIVWCGESADKKRPAPGLHLGASLERGVRSRGDLLPRNGGDVEVADERDQRDRHTYHDVAVTGHFNGCVVAEHERRNDRPPAKKRHNVIEVGGCGRAQRGPQRNATDQNPTATASYIATSLRVWSGCMASTNA
jgi:hypothetical protein